MGAGVGWGWSGVDGDRGGVARGKMSVKREKGKSRREMKEGGR